MDTTAYSVAEGLPRVLTVAGDRPDGVRGGGSAFPHARALLTMPAY
ncbi:hypothetical protein [Streptomyces collinus]